jgi:hypothetical protein
MTVSELKYNYEKNNPRGRFFDRENMSFFGDTMRNFGVCDGGTITTWSGDQVEVWDLYRRRPVNGGLHGYCRSFRKDNFHEVSGAGIGV